MREFLSAITDYWLTSLFVGMYLLLVIIVIKTKDVNDIRKENKNDRKEIDSDCIP